VIGKSRAIIEGYENGTKQIPLSAVVALGMDELLQELLDEMRMREQGHVDVTCPRRAANVLLISNKADVDHIAATADGHLDDDELARVLPLKRAKHIESGVELRAFEALERQRKAEKRKAVELIGPAKSRPAMSDARKQTA